jgi:hypothetical protein
MFNCLGKKSITSDFFKLFKYVEPWVWYEKSFPWCNKSTNGCGVDTLLDIKMLKCAWYQLQTHNWIDTPKPRSFQFLRFHLNPLISIIFPPILMNLLEMFNAAIFYIKDEGKLVQREADSAKQKLPISCGSIDSRLDHFKLLALCSLTDAVFFSLCVFLLLLPFRTQFMVFWQYIMHFELVPIYY